jgi:hypothetical protein
MAREHRPGADDEIHDDDWQPPRPPPTQEELIRTEGQWLWFACYALLVHSGILERGGKPRREIPNTPGQLLAYADELVAFCEKTKRLGNGQAMLDAEAVRRRSSTLRWLMAESQADDKPY